MYNFIVNEHAGGGRAKKAIKKIVAFLNKEKIESRVFYSLYPKHTTELVNELEERDEHFLIAVGGDGTFSEVLNGIKDLEKMKVGFIPAGTGNDFAATLNLNKNPIKAMQDIINGEEIAVDFLENDGIRAINFISVGISTDVILHYNKRRIKTKFSYLLSLLRSVIKFKFIKINKEIDGEEQEEKEIFIASANNGKFLGGGMKLTPLAEINDGKLNYVEIYKIKKRKLPFIMGKVLKGKAEGQDYYKEFVCERVKLSLDGEERTTVNYDGELFENKLFNVNIVKGGLKTFKPQIKEKIIKIKKEKENGEEK